MKVQHRALILTAGVVFLASLAAVAGQSSCDPQSKIHVPIGIPDTLDTLKTFVDADGSFSPGFATFGVYFWLYDPDSKRLLLPSGSDAKLSRGFKAPGALIPWVRLEAGGVQLQTEICEFRQGATDADGLVTAVQVQVKNNGQQKKRLSLIAAVRPMGPAGGSIRSVAVDLEGRLLLLNGKTGLVASRKPNLVDLSSTDDICERAGSGLATSGPTSAPGQAQSESGDCSAAVRFDLQLGGGKTEAFSFLCPVLPGGYAVRHKWDGKDPWAQLDDAVPGGSDGSLQPDRPPATYANLDVPKEAARIFTEATAYWADFTGRAKSKLPDSRWAEALAAITGHLGLCLNEGAPDVAVVNYNVFNRDGVYTANVLQKSGHPDLAARIVDYFIQHPFNGRVYPEADNPGQILWLMGNQWLFTRDQPWLDRVYPSAKRIGQLIQYYRTAPGPHFVALDSLDFGEMIPVDARRELKPGRCDGEHPEYTEAFDIAGLRNAAVLAAGARKREDMAQWTLLAEKLMAKYDVRFGRNLGKDYGGYLVLWPCRLYPFNFGAAFEQFRSVGPQEPQGWRYFPLARAHQSLLAGNREAGFRTIETHLEHEQMKGWCLFDEGGKSGAGGWRHARTNWPSDVAMPHGWAISELWLLMRDSLVHEEANRLIVFGGVPPSWFTAPGGLSLDGFPTHFGMLSVSYKIEAGKVTVKLTGNANPPSGIVLRLPSELKATLVGKGEKGAEKIGNDIIVREGKREIQFQIN